MHDKTGQTIESDDRGRQIASTASLEPLGTVPLTAAHNVQTFVSRSGRIQHFIRSEALDYVAKRYASVSVWPDAGDDPTKIMGFYSLAPFSVERDELNNRYSRRSKTIPGIPVPMGLIGYLGRSPDSPRGFGAVLIIDAARRAARSLDFPVWGLCLHPEDANDKLIGRYKEIGFIAGMGWTRDQTKRLLMYAPLEALLPTAADMAIAGP
jgi:hypothetical protein